MNNTIFLIFATLCIFLNQSCLNRHKAVHIKSNIPALYFNLENTKFSGKIVKLLKENNSEKEYHVIGALSQNARNQGVYQYLITDCNHCRTDNFIFFDTKKIIFLKDSVLLSKAKFCEFYFKFNGDTTKCNKLYFKIQSIILANNNMKYNF